MFETKQIPITKSSEDQDIDSAFQKQSKVRNTFCFYQCLSKSFKVDEFFAKNFNQNESSKRFLVRSNFKQVKCSKQILQLTKGSTYEYLYSSIKFKLSAISCQVQFNLTMELQSNISALKSSICMIKTLKFADLIEVQKRLTENQKIQFVLQIMIQIKQHEIQKQASANGLQINQNQNKMAKDLINLSKKYPVMRYQLLRKRESNELSPIFYKYGIDRQNQYYYNYLDMQKPRIIQPLFFIKKKIISSFKSVFTQFTQKKHSQLKQPQNSGSKMTDLLDVDPDTDLMLIHGSENQINMHSVKVKKLMECRWTILEYSLQDLKEIQSEIHNNLNFKQIICQVQLRIKQLTFLKRLEEYCITSLRYESYIARVYGNLAQISQDLRIKKLKKTFQKQTVEKQKEVHKYDVTELRNFLSEIVVDKKFKVPKSSQEQAALFDLFKKESDIFSALKLCRQKLYFFSLENLIQLENIVAKKQEKDAIQIRAFLNLRIKQLVKKHQDLQIITQLLLHSRLNLQKRLLIQEFQELYSER